MKRRHFVQSVAHAALVPMISRPWTYPWERIGVLHDAKPQDAVIVGDPAISVRDPRIKALAHQAVEAARAAGARYADVRVTQNLWRSISNRAGPSQSVRLGLGVRALANGTWGWAATPMISVEEAVRVAQLATAFANRTASRRALRTVPEAQVDLGTIPVATGDWITPVKIDPFALNLEDLHDWLFGMVHQIVDLQHARKAPSSVAWQGMSNADFPLMSVDFQKQEWLFVSTEGAELTRTVILITPNLNFLLPTPTFNTPIQAGWEYLADMPWIRLMEQAMDREEAAPPPPPEKSIEIGRYDVVFSAAAMAQLLNSTLAVATHLDRAIGEEAYAGSISYLGPDPFAHLGTAVASPLVTITADRSNPIGTATVPWDEEGVVPRDFPLITKGVLQNYQTTRTQAARLAPWYQKRGEPVQSLGCAMAPSALEEPKQHTPNLMLHPGPGSDTEASLVQGLEHGLYITVVPPPSQQRQTGYRPAPLRVDWQCLNGYISPLSAIEIRKGKPIASMPIGKGNRALFFRSDTFWKNIQVLGGSASMEYAGGFMSQKGDPAQFTMHSIGMVPARVKQLAFLKPGQEV